MIKPEIPKKETETTKQCISAESVLSYVVIGCFIVAILGVLNLFSYNGGSGLSLIASAAALGVIAYVYCHKN